jgi:hypothetical protein
MNLKNRLHGINEFRESDYCVEDILLEIITRRQDLFDFMLKLEAREGYGEGGVWHESQ